MLQALLNLPIHPIHTYLYHQWPKTILLKINNEEKRVYFTSFFFCACTFSPTEVYREFYNKIYITIMHYIYAFIMRCSLFIVGTSLLVDGVMWLGKMWAKNFCGNFGKSSKLSICESLQFEVNDQKRFFWDLKNVKLNLNFYVMILQYYKLMCGLKSRWKLQGIIWKRF